MYISAGVGGLLLRLIFKCSGAHLKCSGANLKCSDADLRDARALLNVRAVRELLLPSEGEILDLACMLLKNCMHVT